MMPLTILSISNPPVRRLNQKETTQQLMQVLPPIGRVAWHSHFQEKGEPLATLATLASLGPLLTRWHFSLCPKRIRTFPLLHLSLLPLHQPSLIIIFDWLWRNEKGSADTRAKAKTNYKSCPEIGILGTWQQNSIHNACPVSDPMRQHENSDCVIWIILPRG